MEETEEYQPDAQEQIAQQESAEMQVREVLGSDKTNFAEFLHETKDLPKPLQPFFGVFWNRELGLTNLNEEGVQKLMLLFRICKRNYHIMTPRFEQSAENEILIAELEARVYGKLARSTGGNARDRALFHTAITSHERPTQPRVKGGIFSRFKRGVV